ncbi:asparagine synthase C-terminal domain-containing protein [Halorarius litoreus]|uniref:asparagine synthase C-terminal domain-containing protein n=1 Tax=Halorarius litoreus TaxID=2962676 RepID=UPI0020CBD055|nr:asparagine synthase-related protein [Halorarius litoreus]
MRGAAPEFVRDAIDRDDPLPGSYGFAGELDDRVVRDVLGRELVYTERDDPTVWSHDPDALDAPSLVPAGHARGSKGDERLWTLPDPAPVNDHAEAVAAVRSALVAAVDGAIDDETPVAFSGGVDSAAVAGRHDGPLYVAGFEGCHDVAAAESAADAMDRPVEMVEITHDDLRRATPEVARAIGRSNAMDVAIALPLFLVAERVAADGYDRLAVGQGADELFGGYAKVANYDDDRRVDAASVREARRDTVLTLPGQLERDLRALRAAGVEPVAPLLHDDVVDAALQLPDALLVDGDERKVALRRAADFLPETVSERDKKAVQYGTYVSRELDRLARQNGFKRRMGDHVSKYVDSLL